MKKAERKYINVNILKIGTCYLEKLSGEEMEVLCLDGVGAGVSF